MFETYGIPYIPFAFVIILVLITSITSFLKTMSNNATIRELARAGQPVDPQLVKRLGKDGEDSGSGGMLLGGMITLGVALGLVFFGHELGRIDNDPETAQIFRAIAVFPGVVGVVLVLFGLANALRGKKDSD